MNYVIFGSIYPKLVPVTVTNVPPPVPPLVGVILATDGVSESLYVNAPVSAGVLTDPDVATTSQAVSPDPEIRKHLYKHLIYVYMCICKDTRARMYMHL